MGFKDFIAVIQAPLATHPAAFVRDVLRLTDHVPLTTMTYEELCRQPEYVAVVEYEGRTVIWWMDEVGKIVSNEQSVLQDALCTAMPEVAWAALAIYDVSNYYGFALFESGRRLRCRSGSFESSYSDGEELPEEQHYFCPSTERGEDGGVLYEKDGETWEHHQIGGEFVSGPFSCRVLGGNLHSSEVDGLLEARWSVFGTPLQLERFRAWESQQRVERILRLHGEFELGELATHYGLNAAKLRTEFSDRLQANVQLLLGKGFELQAVESDDGNIQLFSYFKAARLPLFAESQIPLRLARTLDPSIKAGEELGLRLGYRSREKHILPAILERLETQSLPPGLSALLRCHEDESLNRSANDALDEALRNLGAQRDTDDKCAT